MSKVNPIPEGCHSVTPHLVVQGGAAAIEFYQKAFGAEEICRMNGPDGKSVMHAELQIGDSRIFLCDEFPEHGARGPKSIGGTPVTVHLYVDDAKATVDQAAAAGATVSMPVTPMFWGDHYGKIEDPFGHQWGIATHVEDLSPEEIEKRAGEAFGNC